MPHICATSFESSTALFILKQSMDGSEGWCMDPSGCRCDIVLTLLLGWHCCLLLSSFILTQASSTKYLLFTFAFSSVLFMFRLSCICLYREQSLLTARRDPILSRERVYERIRYPNVYDSYAEATKSPAFVGGARVRLFTFPLYLHCVMHLFSVSKRADVGF